LRPNGSGPIVAATTATLTVNPKPPIDLLTTFARFGREQRISLRDLKFAESFIHRVNETLTTALDNDALLHGQRTQNMFEALVVSLGHYKLLDTTNHYAQANLETKRKALERVGAPAPGKKLPSWKRDASVLAWLDSL
jgi:hypothetical protein